MMNRRTFFKVMASAVAATTLPVSWVESDSPAILENNQLSLIREITQYDIINDCIVARWDILTDKSQFFVSMPFCDEKDLIEKRAVARSMLEEKMKNKGFTWADLRPLAVPDSLSFPFQRIAA
jgi:hypothetical protein